MTCEPLTRRTRGSAGGGSAGGPFSCAPVTTADQAGPAASPSCADTHLHRKGRSRREGTDGGPGGADGGMLMETECPHGPHR